MTNRLHFNYCSATFVWLVQLRFPVGVPFNQPKQFDSSAAATCCLLPNTQELQEDHRISSRKKNIQTHLHSFLNCFK